MPVDLRVVTYNIHGNRKRHALATTVREMAPDVLVVQEAHVWGNPLSWRIDLAEQFGMTHASGGLSSSGNVILVARGIAVRNAWVVPFPFTWAESPRGAVFARCAYQGSTFVAAGSHLSPDAGLRLRQADVFKDALDRAGVPQLVGVDTNEDPGGPAWTRLGAGLVDCAVDRGQGGVPTYSTGRPARRLDALLVTPTVAVTGYRVPAGPPVRVASDHFPVVADVTL